MLKDGVDQTMVEGRARFLSVPNPPRSSHIQDVGSFDALVALGGSTHTAFSTETFLDELADAAGIDALAIRQKLAGSPSAASGRAQSGRVRKAGWGQRRCRRARRAARGALSRSGRTSPTWSRVSAGDDGLPKVERVVAAADCGIAIKPDVVKAQLEGGMGYGLSAILYGAIDMEDGRIVQSNFNDYRAAHQRDAEGRGVHRALDGAPSGIGEPGVLPIGPAVANASGQA